MISDKAALELIRNRLSQHRFEHCLNVAAVAREMAETFAVDEQQAYLVGLLHDYAKGISGHDLLILADENGLIEDETERKIPDILHAPVGAFLLQREQGINDREMLQAISAHTLGSLSMTSLDKIIFLADMIEPGRDFPGLDRLKCLSMRDLDQGMLYGLECTIRYCLDEGRVLHPRTIAVRNRFLEICDRRG